ncbi:hypothetical protein ACSW9V_15320 (plasmid) [Clostridium perfringens]|uniref:hypothetical protein n=1 Tax=Clostridium perfringens TaxID=1502 RepID=UPI000B39C461|nr:hypothetical protein [Clostridium perfringens]EGT0690624.1 hypothetical protein [Clostridium perfringens]EGT0694087.1 hypothetical protein [Clostridium perfringens]MDU3376253.1 hypothetical protein [Clostridium perfringens]MDU3534209.1 hypothetical protein [Clostridium perfringens]OUN51183.1 hypothetical protein B5G18_13520 [Clostridium perfringens]
MNTILVTNAAFYLKQLVDELTKDLLMKDINFINVREKVDLEELENSLVTLPFMDSFKVLVFDTNLYSNKELKTLADLLKANPNVKALGFYFIKDKLDKFDPKLKKVFSKENNFNIKTSTKVDMPLIRNLLKENQLDISPEIFQFHDNMDVVINDINKISCLDKSSLEDPVILKRYLSDSFDSNVFELIDALLSKNVDLTLEKLQFLLSTKNQFEINIIILKHLILLRLIKNGEDMKSAALKERFSGGKGTPIHPYRFNLLKKSSVNINLDFAINELLENDLKKKFNLELSILKILNQGV